MPSVKEKYLYTSIVPHFFKLVYNLLLFFPFITIFIDLRQKICHNIFENTCGKVIALRIEEIDKNLKIVSALDLEDVVWFDVRKAPFKIYGLLPPQENDRFRRMPEEVAKSINEGVYALHDNTAGGRVRFHTDSPYVAIKTEQKNTGLMGHITKVGQSGLDLYISRNCEKFTFKGSFVPAASATDGFETYVTFSEGGMPTDCEINLPNYDNLINLYVGIKKGSTLDSAREYKYTTPVLFLGSSITQGGCASRPGNGYVNMISRDLDTDVVNLGFSGSCQGEFEMADYIIKQPMSVFVYDYDHNAPTPEHLWATHEPFFKRFRAARPTVPVVFINKPDWINDPGAPRRREAVYTTYKNALANGDENVYFIEGNTLWGGENPNDCTVDGCHPNDLGFFRMAQKIGSVIKEILEK